MGAGVDFYIVDYDRNTDTVSVLDKTDGVINSMGLETVRDYSVTKNIKIEGLNDDGTITVCNYDRGRSLKLLALKKINPIVIDGKLKALHFLNPNYNFNIDFSKFSTTLASDFIVTFSKDCAYKQRVYKFSDKLNFDDGALYSLYSCFSQNSDLDRVDITGLSDDKAYNFYKHFICEGCTASLQNKGYISDKTTERYIYYIVKALIELDNDSKIVLNRKKGGRCWDTYYWGLWYKDIFERVKKQYQKVFYSFKTTELYKNFNPVSKSLLSPKYYVILEKYIMHNNKLLTNQQQKVFRMIYNYWIYFGNTWGIVEDVILRACNYCKSNNLVT